MKTKLNWVACNVPLSQAPLESWTFYKVTYKETRNHGPDAVTCNTLTKIVLVGDYDEDGYADGERYSICGDFPDGIIVAKASILDVIDMER